MREVPKRTVVLFIVLCFCFGLWEGFERRSSCVFGAEMVHGTLAISSGGVIVAVSLAFSNLLMISLTGDVAFSIVTGLGEGLEGKGNGGEMM